MFLLGFLSWWYGAGWRQRAHKLRSELMAMEDYFSIDLLLKTLFSPFRQISAGKVQGPIGIQMRAFFDRLVSRIIGAVVRSIVMIIGIVVIIMNAIIGAILLLLWGFVPLLPVVGSILFATGWIPWKP